MSHTNVKISHIRNTEVIFQKNEFMGNLIQFLKFSYFKYSFFEQLFN